MKKSLGGDRLGSGSKLSVNLKNYERSTHDLSRVWRSSMASGTLVPFLSELALPGDTFDIDLDCDIKTHPTVGPLFGSYKVQLDIFQCPIRLYQAQLHNNKLGIGMNMQNVLLPQLLVAVQNSPTTIPDVNTMQINPSCILNYLGISGFGLKQAIDETPAARYFNAIPLIAYWDIFKNYYANKQETKAFAIHTPDTTIINTITQIDVNQSWTGGTAKIIPKQPATPTAVTVNTGWKMAITYAGTKPKPSQVIFSTLEYGDMTGEEIGHGWTDGGSTLLVTPTIGPKTIQSWRYITDGDVTNQAPKLVAFDLTEVDTLRENILKHDGASAFVIQASDLQSAPWQWVLDSGGAGTRRSSLSSQEGLAVKTFQSDIFNNWLSTEWIDGTNGISEITAIDTSDGSFTLDTLNLSKKVYDMLNRIAVSGGTYSDWLDAVYTHERYTQCTTPMYMGGLSKELIFQAVVSNSESQNQPLGTLAGKGAMSGKNKGGKVTVKVDEPSYIMGIISLTPRIDYSQGNRWDTQLKTMDDLHKPALDEIGFQELITEQMAWWDTTWDGTKWIQNSAGKQPAWLNYMTAYNTTHGNFAIPNNEMFMTLNRRYEQDAVAFKIKDLTTYIDPSKFNFIFAETALDSQNFWAQIGIDITARRKMSARVMPNL